MLAETDVVLLRICRRWFHCNSRRLPQTGLVVASKRLEDRPLQTTWSLWLFAYLSGIGSNSVVLQSVAPPSREGDGAHATDLSMTVPPKL